MSLYFASRLDRGAKGELAAVAEACVEIPDAAAEGDPGKDGPSHDPKRRLHSSSVRSRGIDLTQKGLDLLAP
jgi:hypothetical protein